MMNLRVLNKGRQYCPYQLHLLLQGLLYLLFYAVGKMAFMLYNHEIEAFTARDIWQVWKHGFSMDLTTAGYLLLIPWIVSFCSIWKPNTPIRKILRPYFFLASLLVVLITLADICLYEFWQSKIDSNVLLYFDSLEGATASVSWIYITMCTLLLILITGTLAFGLIRLTPKSIPAPQPRKGTLRKSRILHSLVMTLCGALLALAIRGGVQESTMNVGVAYYSPKLFLNHAAVNPVFSIMYSLSKAQRYDKQFRYLEKEECAATFAHLYPSDTEDITDTLLTTQHPNVLIVLMEGYGGKFIEALGGIPEVSPNLNQLIKEGIFFDNCWANSFRTDRGTVCTFSGHVSYPTVSIMKLQSKCEHLPSLAKSLGKQGYSTSYVYGGDIDFMGTKGYLISTGFENIACDDDFSFSQVNESKWGANDEATCKLMLSQISHRATDSHWFSVLQTLSSHEPFEVPYNRLKNKKLNAFAYTDACIGQFINQLKAMPQWNNLLVILIPDHGFLYETTYEKPDFFHIPMLWLGGAIREPRTIHTLMNQSDMAATLLSQMNISHRDFTWSRNIFSRNYTYPFVYSSYPSGILFKDSTGVTIFDTTADRIITEQPTPNPERLQRAKAILQTSYNQLAAMH